MTWVRVRNQHILEGLTGEASTHRQESARDSGMSGRRERPPSAATETG
jgi:hypothetical protein